MMATLLLGVVLAPLVVALLLRLVLGAKGAGQVGFGVIVLTSCLPPYFLSVLGSFYTESGSEEAKAKKRASFAKVVVVTSAFCWRIALACCPWIKLDIDGVAECRRNFGKTGRPLCYISNHTSYLDIFVATALLPLSHVGKVKMIVSSHVLKMPVIGKIASTAGHLAVPFKDTSESSTTFEVDKEKLAEVMQKYEEHLKSGEACAWFPEGQVHKGDCSKLQQFRAGGLGIAVRNDVELWSLSLVGNAVSWPSSLPLGGFPARIGGKLSCVCESSKEFLSSDEAGKDEREKSIYLANKTQGIIQADIEAYIAKGYKAGDNTRKKKSEEKKAEEKKVD